MSLGLQDLEINDTGIQVKDKFNSNLDIIEEAIDDKANTTHTHGYISTAGKLLINGVVKNNFVLFTDSEGRITGETRATAFNKAFGTGSGNISEGNHNHIIEDISGLVSALALKAASTHTHVPSDITGIENIGMDITEKTITAEISGANESYSSHISVILNMLNPAPIMKYELTYEFDTTEGLFIYNNTIYSSANVIYIPKLGDDSLLWDENGSAKMNIAMKALNPINNTETSVFNQTNVAIKRYNSMDIPQLVDALIHSESFIKAIAPVFAANPAFASLVASQISEK